MAKDVNSIFLVGRLTRTLGSGKYDFSYTANNTPIGKISIANNRKKKQGDKWVDEVNYFDVVIFGKQAEVLKPYLVKGKQVAITGELKQERWIKDNKTFSRIEIVASDIQLLGNKNDSNHGSNNYSNVNNDFENYNIDF